MNIVVAMALLAIIFSVAIACSAQPEVRVVEVTREVSVVQDVPVTRLVETVKTVEVEREVPVVKEVVTVEEIPVTRQVEVLQQVEVTREVPVTRLVTATPGPANTSTAKELPTASPASTATPVPTATPAPAATSLFGNWRMERESYGGEAVFLLFRNVAVAYETAGDAPVLTYQCSASGDSAMHIDWHHLIATAESNISRGYHGNPFAQYQDDDLDALVEYTADLSKFVGDLNLSQADQIDLDEVWTEVGKYWQLSEETPDQLIRRMRNRTHRSVLIDLDFYRETVNSNQKSKYGPPVLATISGRWVVLSDSRAQINAGAIGEINRSVRQIENPRAASDELRVMTATVKEPAQPATVIAKWEVNGFRKVIDYCKIIRQ